MSGVIELTRERAIELMDEVVNEYGADHLYRHPDGDGDSCFYVQGGKPDCLIGKILNRAGVPIHKFEPFEGYGAEALAGLMSRSHRAYEAYLPPGVGGPLFTSDKVTITALRIAQEKQDQGLSWGEARFAFRETLAKS